jgi:hypothetical protein
MTMNFLLSFSPSTHDIVLQNAMKTSMASLLFQKEESRHPDIVLDHRYKNYKKVRDLNSFFVISRHEQ